MASLFPTNAAQVQAFAAALYGIQVGTSTMTQVNADINSAGGLNNALNGYFNASFGGLPTTSVGTLVATNLGLTGDALTSGSAYITGVLNQAAPAARGAAIESVLNLFAGLTADKTYGAAATAWNSKVANAVSYTGTGDVPLGSVVASSGQVFSLTAGTNVFTGTAGDDTFDAGLSSSSLQTLNSGDKLSGGEGTDELFAVVNGSVTPAAISSIENVTLTNITTGATVDLSNATGLKNVSNQASTVAMTLAGVSKSANVTVRDTAIAGQVVSFSDVTGTADAAAVNVQNVTGAATLTVAGVEELTLNSTGSATNVLATLTTVDTKTLKVAGNQGMNAGTLSTAVTKLDASANTGVLAGVTAIMANTGANFTVVGGSGNDSITLGSSGGNDNVDGGAGNDTIIYTANLTTADTINGGDGTDTLRATAANLVTISAATPTTYTVTNVETIQATDAPANNSSITVQNISATATRLNLATTGAVIAGTGDSVVGGAGSFTLGLGGSAAGNTAGLLTNASTLTVTDTGTGTDDSVTILNSAVNSTTGLNVNVYASSNLAINGYETVTINSGSIGASATAALGTVTVTGDATDKETVKFSGSNNVTVGVITADIVDASALTAASGTVLTMVTNSTATTVIGSAGIDILFGNTALASSVDGGAGNDTITGGTGNDTLLGGDGADTITTGGGAGDSVDGGAGNDVVVATLTAGNKMVGGDGTDVLSLAVAATAATATGVSGFETARSTAAITQDMVQFLDNSTFTRLEGDFAGTTAFTNVGAGVTTLATTLAGNTSTFARLVDTSSNSLNLVLIGNATTTAITANNEETINVSTSSAVGTTTLTDLTATDLHTLNITGSNAIVFTNAIGANSTTAGTTLTINAAANTGGVTVSAANSTIAASITGSTSASNVLTGTAGTDTIIGGAAADTIAGGGGADVLTGGSGADTFTIVATGTASNTGSSHASSFVTITDFAKSSDMVGFTGAILTAAGGSGAAGQAAISANGRATFNVADSTLALRITATEAGINAAGAAAAGQAAMFTFGSDTYVFISNGVDGITAADVVVKLTGLAISSTSVLTPDGGNAFFTIVG